MPEIEERPSSISLDEFIKILLLMPFRAALMAIFYLLSLLIFNVSVFKALVVAFAVFMSLIAKFANRLLGRFGVLLFAYALAFWIGAAPAPADLRDSLVVAARTAFSVVQSAKQ